MQPLIGTSIVLIISLILCSSQNPPPVVEIQGLGTVQGSVGYTAWTNRTIYEFHAIRYAQSPIGSLRFQVEMYSTLKFY